MAFHLYDYTSSTSHDRWQPGYWFAPDGGVLPDTNSWVVNPFNPATPVNVYANANGILKLSIQALPPNLIPICGSQAYASAIIHTQPSFRQLYGYFEASIAATQCQGIYYTFSLMTDICSPPQIDIATIVSLEGTNNTWFCRAGAWDPNAVSLLPANTWNSFNTQSLQNYDITQFHTYGCDWQKTGMTFYVDRIPVFQCASPPGYTYAMFPVIGINCGVPGSVSGAITNPTLLPVSMSVKSVRIWQSLPF